MRYLCLIVMSHGFSDRHALKTILHVSRPPTGPYVLITDRLEEARVNS